MSQQRRSGQFVVPGQKLGVIEEFIPNSGTYVQEGFIHSMNTGYVLLDYPNRKITVYPLSSILVYPKINSVVLGSITSVQSSSATVQIERIGTGIVSGYFTGLIHISDVSFKYIESMFNAFKVSDLVRAKVISLKNKTFHLSTKGQNLGVISAYCSKCGAILRFKRRILKCESCNHTERRSISIDYGKETL